jgi:hypothetical protein
MSYILDSQAEESEEELKALALETEARAVFSILADQTNRFVR